MRKEVRAISSICIMAVLLLGIKVTARAEYFDHHVDWPHYCMQARDVTVTEEELKRWIGEGILEEELIKESEVFAREFRASNSAEPWREYTGGYEADTVQAENIQLNGQKAGEAKVTFYMNREDKGENYITIMVRVTDGSQITEPKADDAETSDAGRPDETVKKREKAEATESLKGSSNKRQNEKSKQKEDKSAGDYLLEILPVINMWIAISAFTAFSVSLYSDCKVLSRYYKKLSRREVSGR